MSFSLYRPECMNRTCDLAQGEGIDESTICQRLRDSVDDRREILTSRERSFEVIGQLDTSPGHSRQLDNAIMKSKQITDDSRLNKSDSFSSKISTQIPRIDTKQENQSLSKV
jgi:hypothetical protein